MNTTMSFTCVIYVQPHPSPLPHTRIRPCRHKTVLSEPVDGASGCGHGTAAALGLPELTRDTADTAMAYVGNHPDYCGTAVVTMAGGSRLQTKATETSNKSNRDFKQKQPRLLHRTTHLLAESPGISARFSFWPAACGQGSFPHRTNPNQTQTCPRL